MCQKIEIPDGSNQIKKFNQYEIEECIKHPATLIYFNFLITPLLYIISLLVLYNSIFSFRSKLRSPTNIGSIISIFNYYKSESHLVLISLFILNFPIESHLVLISLFILNFPIVYFFFILRI